MQYSTNKRVTIADIISIGKNTQNQLEIIPINFNTNNINVNAPIKPNFISLPP